MDTAGEGAWLRSAGWRGHLSERAVEWLQSEVVGVCHTFKLGVEEASGQCLSPKKGVREGSGGTEWQGLRTWKQSSRTHQV